MTSHSFRSSLDLVSNLPSFIFNSNANLNISVTGQGRTKEFWDGPLNMSANFLAGQIFTIPLISTVLTDSYYYDSILLLTVDGNTRLPYAFSNSPDNPMGAAAIENKVLYWPDLYCFGQNNNLGSNDTGDYTFGGVPAQLTQNLQHRLNFSEPPAVDTNYTWLIQHVSYVDGLTSYSLSGTGTVLAGQLSSIYFSGALFDLFYLNGGTDIGASTGYLSVVFNFIDPAFRSMLTAYHFGIAETPVSVIV
jgi:hypothetical protein